MTSSARSTRSSTAASGRWTSPRSTDACSSTTCRWVCTRTRCSSPATGRRSCDTLLDTVPDVLGPEADALRPAPGPVRAARSTAGAAILISNNRYRLGAYSARGLARDSRVASSGSRYCVPIAAAGDGGVSHRLAMQQWTTTEFEVDSRAADRGRDRRRGRSSSTRRCDSGARPGALRVAHRSAAPGGVALRARARPAARHDRRTGEVRLRPRSRRFPDPVGATSPRCRPPPRRGRSGSPSRAG